MPAIYVDGFMRTVRPAAMGAAFAFAMLAGGQAPAAALASIGDYNYSAAHIDQAAALSLDPAEGIALAGRDRTKLSLSAGTDAEEGRDWEGLKQDTLYFGFTQLAVIGVLYISPQSISRWSAEDKDQYDFQKWKDNVSNPVWDTDQWWINYIMHPYWGGSYYVRASERGYEPTQSFWYSFALSTMYEFGAEALFEPVSVQDLIFTPGLGFFVGRYFMSVREGIQFREMNGEALSGTDRATLIMTDPLGAVNRQINSALGRQASFTLSPAVMLADAAGRMGPADAYVVGQSRELFTGLRLRLIW